MPLRNCSLTLLSLHFSVHHTLYSNAIFCFCRFTGNSYFVAICCTSICVFNVCVNILPSNGLFSRTTWVSQYQEGKTSLDLNEARDYGVLGCSGISWTICKQSAPRCRQITTPTPHHSIFTGWMLFLTLSQQCQSTERR